MKPLSLFVVME
jgi:hypothetical protein